jgi:hypothetical protein
VYTALVDDRRFEEKVQPFFRYIFHGIFSL